MGGYYNHNLKGVVHETNSFAQHAHCHSFYKVLSVSCQLFSLYLQKNILKGASSKIRFRSTFRITNKSQPFEPELKVHKQLINRRYK